MAYEIVIPRLGWSMEEGTFVRWLKNDGDHVRPGEAVFELEGEKASQDIEAVDEGILRISPTGPQPGTVLKVGAVIGFLVAEGEPAPGVATSSQAGSPPPADPSLPPVAAPSVRRLAREAGIALSQIAGSGPGGRVLPTDVRRASPLPPRGGEAIASDARPLSSNERTPAASPRARRAASELGVDWARLTGTGAGGRIRECDVRAAVAQNESLSSALGKGQRLPLTSRRRLIAQRMVASRQQTVPVTLATKADATNLVNLREQFKAVGGSASIPGYQDIIIKLVAEVLKRHLLLAGRWDEDAITIPAEDELNIGIAVNTEQGLLVPVVRNVCGLTLTELAHQSRRLGDLARAGKLAVADMQGGVFTITNLGAFGIDAFTPIINTPEAAILGLGAIRREAVVLNDGQIGVREQLTLSLTFDHRILDGAPAARFLKDVVSAIANPSAWLLN